MPMLKFFARLKWSQGLQLPAGQCFSLPGTSWPSLWGFSSNCTAFPWAELWGLLCPAGKGQGTIWAPYPCQPRPLQPGSGSSSRCLVLRSGCSRFVMKLCSLDDCFPLPGGPSRSISRLAEAVSALTSSCVLVPPLSQALSGKEVEGSRKLLKNG